ncbi:MAG: ATP phosphoribosyltransferase regulatory subunit [Lachnospiraceae bacterium]|nr:ATP phosphoribosyltransferase regulatory subunit [Lachnospiraceae bacterium]
MKNSLLHTPEGVRDIYGEEYARKLWVEDVIRKQFGLYGYEVIQTPTFEFFDVFSREVGTTPSKDLFKLIDGEGNTMVLRPDFTPGVTRCVAKYYHNLSEPLRLCYQGNTYTNTSSLQGKQKEVTEMGVELIGDESIFAEAETIALAIESLLAVGLKEFQISIGQVEYFKGMCEAAGINDDTELKLRDFISEKNIFGAENLLVEAGISEEHRNRLININDLFGAIDILRSAKKQADNKRSIKAVERLLALYEILCHYRVEKYVAFDLGMLSKYNYYTSIIFKCFAYGVGDVIARGGRYDNLLKQFGKPAPAVGFGLIIDDLMAALNRQKAEIPEESIISVIYNDDNFQDALAEARVLRKEGRSVKLKRM